MPGEEMGKELLGQVAGSFLVPAFVADEREHRLPVGFAKLAEGGLGFSRFAPGLEDLRPAGGGEMAGGSLAARNGGFATAHSGLARPKSALPLAPINK